MQETISQEEATLTTENIRNSFSSLKSRWESMKQSNFCDLMLDEALSEETNGVLETRLFEYLDPKNPNKLFEGPIAYLYLGIRAVGEALDRLNNFNEQRTTHKNFAVTIPEDGPNKESQMKDRLQIIHAVAILQFPANLLKDISDIQYQLQSVRDFFANRCRNVNGRCQVQFGTSCGSDLAQLKECFESMARDPVFIRDADGRKFWRENFQGLFAVQAGTFLDRFGVAVDIPAQQPSLRSLVQKSFDPDQDQIVTQAHFATLCSRSVFSLLRRKIELNEDLSPSERLRLLPLSTCGVLLQHQGACAPTARDDAELAPLPGDDGQDARLLVDLQRLRDLCQDSPPASAPGPGDEPPEDPPGPDGSGSGRGGPAPSESACVTVVLLGATGAGKSTAANALAGCPLRRMTDAEARERGLPPGSLVASGEGGRSEVARIGGGAFQSETRALQRVGLEADGMVLWDAPGFGDTGGPVENLAHAVRLQRLLELTRERGVVLAVLVDYPSFMAQRGAALRDTVGHLARMRGGGEGGGEGGGGGGDDGVLLVLNKVPPGIDAPWLRDMLRNGWAAQAAPPSPPPPWIESACIFDPLGREADPADGRLGPEELKAALVRTPPTRAGLRISISDADRAFYREAAGLARRRAAALLRAGRFDEAAELGETLAALSSLGIERDEVPGGGGGGGGGGFGALVRGEWDQWKLRVAALEADPRRAAREALRREMEWARGGAACARLRPLAGCDMERELLLPAWVRVQREELGRQRQEDQAFAERFRGCLQAAEQELGSEDGDRLLALFSAAPEAEGPHGAGPGGGGGGGATTGVHSALRTLGRYQAVRRLASLLDAVGLVAAEARARRYVAGDQTGAAEQVRARRGDAEDALGDAVFARVARLLDAQLAALRQHADRRFGELGFADLSAAWSAQPALEAADVASGRAWEELARLGLAGGWSEAARAALAARLPDCPARSEGPLAERVARALAGLRGLAHVRCAVGAWEARVAEAEAVRERVRGDMEREAEGLAGDPPAARRAVEAAFLARGAGRAAAWAFVQRLREESAEVRRAVAGLEAREEEEEEGIAEEARAWLEVRADELVRSVRDALGLLDAELGDALSSARQALADGEGDLGPPDLGRLAADLTTQRGMAAAGVPAALAGRFWSLVAALRAKEAKFAEVLAEADAWLRERSASFAASARRDFADQWRARARRGLERGLEAARAWPVTDVFCGFDEAAVIRDLANAFSLAALKALEQFAECRDARNEVVRELESAAEKAVPLARGSYLEAAKGALMALVSAFELGDGAKADRVLRLLDHVAGACRAHKTMQAFDECKYAVLNRLSQLQNPDTSAMSDAEAFGHFQFVAESVSVLARMGAFARHFEGLVDPEPARGRAKERARRLVDGARREIERGIADRDYLETSAIRACFACSEALKRVLTSDETHDLRRLSRENMTNTIRALHERAAAARGAKDSKGDIALALMKGFRVHTEMNDREGFQSMARHVLLDTLDAKGKYEVGLALADHAKSEALLAGGVSVAELAKTVLDLFAEFQHFSIEMWNRKSSSVTFDSAFRAFAGGRHPYPAEWEARMTSAYAEYKDVYEDLVRKMITKSFDVDANLRDIDSVSKSLAAKWPVRHCHGPANAEAGQTFQAFFDPRRSPQTGPGDAHLEAARLVARVCALWTHQGLDCEISGGKDYVRQPHGVQILGLFRLLGVDEDTAGHVIQLNTGEGKSVVLGIGAAVLAKLGFQVNVVCYSTYLSGRDHSAFRELFKALKVDRRVGYSDFSGLCNRIMGENEKFPNSRQALDALLEGGKFEWKPKEVSNSVLLFDEIDVFFSDLFFGHAHRTCTSIYHDSSFGMLEHIWRHRTLPVGALIASVKETVHYTTLCRAYPRIERFLCAEIERAAKDVQCFRGPVPLLPSYAANYVYDEKSRRVGYVREQSKCVSFNIHKGYLTDFTLFSKEGDRMSTPPFRDSRPYLSVFSGSMLFSQVPKCFRHTFGITGTLDCLADYQRELLKGYGFERESVIPSAYEKKPLVVEPTQVHDVWDDWCRLLLDDVKAKLDGERAVLVVFRDGKCLERFEDVFKNRTWPSRPYCELQRLTDDTSSAVRDAVIAKAARRSTVTLATRSFGRGSDFVCRDQGLVAKGGLHVVTTFYPDDRSEETQIRGRTCRQDDPGSFAGIMFLEWIREGGLAASIKEQRESGEGWDEYLSRLRDTTMKDKSDRMLEKDRQQLCKHEQTLKYCADAAAGRVDEALDGFYSMAYG